MLIVPPPSLSNSWKASLYSIRKGRWKGNHYLRNDVINMPRTREKDKIWVPDRNCTYGLPYRLVGCSSHWATKDSWQARPYTRFMYDIRPAYCYIGSHHFYFSTGMKIYHHSLFITNHYLFIDCIIFMDILKPTKVNKWIKMIHKWINEIMISQTWYFFICKFVDLRTKQENFSLRNIPLDCPKRLSSLDRLSALKCMRGRRNVKKKCLDYWIRKQTNK